jgi:hypothetical protein
MAIDMADSRYRGLTANPVSIALSLLLLLAAATVQAQTVPMPREKPAAADEDPSALIEEVKPAVPASSCLQELEDAGVVIDNDASIVSGGGCTVMEPVVVESIGTRAGRIELPGRPMLDCRFASVLAAWLREVVSPVAASMLGSPVDSLVTGPGYQCRSRAGGKLSEHAIGNAIDISHFRLVGGRNITIEALPRAEGAEREFLRAISASACGYFTTVLGPGSDAAHSDHLHVDLAERRTTEFRICMAR